MTLRLLSIRIKSDKLERKLKNILFTYKHFESCLSSSAKITTYTKKAKIQTTLASPQLMRNALYCESKHSTQVEYLKNKYKKNQMWQALKETVKKFIKLLKYIEYKAQEYGIRVHYVDERYTSKASCISDDIRGIPNGYCLTNAFNGKRVKRGLFLDAVINKIFNADINGAINYSELLHLVKGGVFCFNA